MNTRFTFVIPVPKINDYVRETVSHILELPERNWELLVVPNDWEEPPWSSERIRIVSSGRVGPGDKRDLGARESLGEILVFLDDDSYPNANFLHELAKVFDEGYSVVGGPAVTPPQDPFWSQVSGAVFLSKVTGGTPERYLPVGDERLVIDWPTVNLAIRRDVFIEAGGFDCRFWPGEDTFLCDKLAKAGVAIRYSPSVVAWHHRRPTLKGHLRQVGGYGLHRGYFARHYAESSRKLMYFIPSALVLYVLLGILLASFWPPVRLPFILSIAAYLGIQLIAAANVSRLVGNRVAVASVPYVILTHFWYGLRFIRGFAMNKPLVSKLR